jgi:hypothetical protein|tara:strand:- start:2809 stop:3249 length:441 start_codon:yes stop_codon:yes gene_type:complete
MSKKEFFIPLCLLVLLVLTSRAFAETIVPPQPQTLAEQAIGQPISRPLMCGPMEQLVPTLQERGEVAVWRGVLYVPSADGNPFNGLHEVWMWVNHETGTWTIIEIHVMEDESVLGCIYAFGLLPSHMPETESTTEPPQGPVINKME